MNYLDIIIPFVGGLGMFIYGMQIMAQKSIIWSPFFRAYYDKKRNEGFSHRKAMIAVMNKLTKIIFTLLTRGEMYKEQS